MRDLALFDFDNTITTVDTFTGFIRSVTSPARRWLGGILLLPVILMYRTGLVSASATRQIVVFVALAGASRDAVKTHGEKFVRQYVVDKLSPQAIKKLQWHKQRGDRIVVVSASLDVYLHAWCTAQQLEVICAELTHKHGRLTGRYRDCTGEEKAARVKAQIRLGDYAQVHAYGDSDEDDAMLALADVKWKNWRAVQM